MLLVAGIVWQILGLLLFVGSGAAAVYRDLVESLARRLGRRPVASDQAEDRSAPPFASVALYYALYSATIMVWTLPIDYAGLAIERAFGFASQSNLLFLQDHLLSLCIGWLIIPVVWGTYRLYAVRPNTWWLYMWAAIVPLNAFATIVYPVLISPLYNRYAPLAPGRLREEILALAGKAGIHHSEVFVEDTSRRTSHVNAYVTGIGPSTRIVINDTAMQKLPEDQILALVGHEMGHYVERHVLIGFGIASIGTGLLLGLLAALLPRIARRCGPACGLRGLNDLAVLPLVMLTIYLVNLATAPIRSALSREMEHRADAYGLRITGLTEATAQLMVGFAERDLTDPDPPHLLHLWFGTHPTVRERIDFALQFRSPASPPPFPEEERIRQ